MQPLHVTGKCIASDGELFANIDLAMARGLPELEALAKPHDGHIAIVGSGPDLVNQLDELRAFDGPIVAVKDAHDWLQERGILPHYAFAVDPQEHRWNCFKKKHPDIEYVIAAQCHPAMFDHLKDMRVTLWYPYVKADTFYPPNKFLIGGGTTSGLRAIAVFYMRGWRHLDLFGFDSCLQDGLLRVNGTPPKVSDPIQEISLSPHDRSYRCNPTMALQAQNFQSYYDWMPDATFHAHGSGLIPAIIRRKEQQAITLAAIQEQPADERISFIHNGGAEMASYRYRALIPSMGLGALFNDFTAGTLIFSKPQPHELMDMAAAKLRGARIIVDICDDHLEWTHYQEAIRLATVLSCPTSILADKLTTMGYPAVVIPDPYEFPRAKPHTDGVRLLWFGHAVNRESLTRVLPSVREYPLRVVSNFDGAIPWSYNTMLREFRAADIVIVPATEPYKSANRAVESIRQGCFVVAEPHPALDDIPGIWIGNIKEGIEWTKRHSSEARQRTALAQAHVMEKYAPKIVTAAWKTLIESLITSAVGEPRGLIGSMSI